jgi:Leucine-rich repeat (LRR) protein
MRFHSERIVRFLLVVAVLPTFLGSPALAVDPVFPDRGLEAAVRQEVFAKRYNQEPLTVEDVKNISRVAGKKRNIVSLEGLQHCQAVLEIDLENNAIVDVVPLRDLKKVQSLNLAGNQIETIEPLAELNKLQYLELSRNRLSTIEPVSQMTNMRSLYLSDNQIRSLKPISNLKKVWSLYAARNPLEDLSAIRELKWLETLDLSATGLSDLKALDGLGEIKRLALSKNKIESLEPLVVLCETDAAGPKRFASYLRFDIRENPLSEIAKTKQLPRLRELGVRVTLDDTPEK